VERQRNQAFSVSLESRARGSNRNAAERLSTAYGVETT
jgi:hypothetical protein